MQAIERTPGARVRPAGPGTLRALDALNFFLADVQTGVGPFLAIYLAGRHWNPEAVGLALTVAGIAGIAAQTPAGWLVDRARSKRVVIAVGLLALGVSAVSIALAPAFWPVIAAQVTVGAAASVFIPAVCAISLGAVGRARFDARQGRNQVFNAAGNVSAAIAMGALGYFVSNRSVFFLVVALIVPTLVALGLIREEEIDHDLARGGGAVQAATFRDLLRDRTLVFFCVAAVLFHFANAAMLPLLGQTLAQGRGRSSMLFMSACVITTQLVVTLISGWSGRAARVWGRKSLLLIAFCVLPLRGVLYTVTDQPGPLIAIQVLDGVGVGIFNVVSVLVIADLTAGTGRFNLTLGAINAAVALGAALSQVIAGSVVQRAGFRTGMFALSGIAVAALAVLYFFVRETRPVDQHEGAR